MEENVLKGTGKNAYVKGYGIGGKTATAEKVIKNEGVYDKRKLVSSFLSIFPIKSPKYICLVLFDEPFLKIILMKIMVLQVEKQQLKLLLNY